MVVGLSLGPSLPRAEACSGYQQGNISSRLVFPADGTTGVPTNAQVVVSYVSAGDKEAVVDHLGLRSSTGEGVPVTISQPITNPSGYLIQKTFVLVPSQPLAPNTEYQVLSDIATLPCIQNTHWASSMSTPACRSILDGGGADDGAGAVSTAVSSFTTDGGPNKIHPTLSGAITYTSETQSCTSSACCGPYEGYSVSLRWDAATYTGGDVFYELSREGVVILYPIQAGDGQVAGNGVRGAFLCSGGKSISTVGSFGYEQFQAQPGKFQVVAVNMAGNRSGQASVEVTVDCPLVDGGANAGDATPIDDANRGEKDVFPPADPVTDDAPAADTAQSTDLPPTHADTMIPIPDTPDAAIAAKPDAPPAIQDAKTVSPKTNGTNVDAALARSGSSGCSCQMSSRGQGLGVILIVALGLAVRRRRP